MSKQASFTNVSVQKFATETDAALFDRNWSEHGPVLLKKLGELGMLSFSATKVWNQDDELTRMYVFEYESPEAVNACLPVWKEIEKLVFAGVSMKVTAYRRQLRDMETRLSHTGRPAKTACGAAG